MQELNVREPPPFRNRIPYLSLQCACRVRDSPLQWSIPGSDVSFTVENGQWLGITVEPSLQEIAVHAACLAGAWMYMLHAWSMDMYMLHAWGMDVCC